MAQGISVVGRAVVVVGGRVSVVVWDLLTCESRQAGAGISIPPIPGRTGQADRGRVCVVGVGSVQVQARSAQRARASAGCIEEANEGMRRVRGSAGGVAGAAQVCLRRRRRQAAVAVCR